MGIPHNGSPEGIVTLSLGVAVVSPDGRATEERLIALADAALYEAKQRGRNRVETAETSAHRSEGK